jgi:type I restriction enzyme M protein
LPAMVDPISRLRGLRDELWAGGLSGSLNATEQVAYVAVAKVVLPPHEWKWLCTASADLAFDRFRFDLFRTISDAAPTSAFEQAMRGADFDVPTAELLRSIVSVVSDLSFTPPSGGENFTQLLSVFGVADAGDYATPPELATLLARLVHVGRSDLVCDPACGTGGLLVAAHRFGDANNAEIFGYDVNSSRARLTLLNLAFHGVADPSVFTLDALRKLPSGSSFDVVLSNPPFAGTAVADKVDPQLDLDTRRTELLYVERCRQLLRTGGRCAIVVPMGVLFGTSKAHVEVRRRLLTRAQLYAIITFDRELFSSTRVELAVLFFGRTRRRTNWVTFLASADELERVPDQLVAAATAQTAASGTIDDHAWTVSVADIRDANWDLTPHRYRPFDPEEVSYEDPHVPLAELEELQRQFTAGLARLRRVLG